MIDTFDLKGEISRLEFESLSRHFYISQAERKNNPNLPEALNEIAKRRGKEKVKPVSKQFNNIILNVRKFQGLGNGEGRSPIFKITLSKVRFRSGNYYNFKYFLTLAIKPLALLDEWESEFETLAANQFCQVEQGFDKARAKLKSENIIAIPDYFFSCAKVSRVDLTFDVDIPEDETNLYIELLKKCDFNYYHKKATKEPNPEHKGIRVGYRQFALNIYNKLTNQNAKRRDSQKTKNLRLEIQLYKAFFNSNREFNKSGTEFFMLEERDVIYLFNKMFKELFKYCFRKGEYLTTQNAEKIVNNSFTQTPKKKALIKVLKSIARKGIPETLKACENENFKVSGKYISLAQCNTYLKELERLNINPITISKALADKYGADSLHNLNFYFQELKPD